MNKLHESPKRFHIGWRGEQNILYKGVKSLPSRPVLKTLRESSKRTIFVSGGLGLLLMVSKLDTERYASEEVESRKAGGHEAVCHQGRWAPNGGGLEGPTLVEEENKTLFIRVKTSP